MRPTLRFLDRQLITQIIDEARGLLKTLGEYTEARPLFERSLAIDEVQLGVFWVH